MKAKKEETRWYVLVVAVTLIIAILGWSVFTPEGSWRWGCSIAFLSKGSLPAGCEVSPTGLDFELGLEPTSGRIANGESTTTTVIIGLASKVSPRVYLTVSGLPSYTTASFSPPSCNPECQSTMTITTTPSTPKGVYTLTISAKGGPAVKTINYDLVVAIPNLEVRANSAGMEVQAKVATGLGDVNWDGIIDRTDLDLVANAYGSEVGDPNWNQDADMNYDGIINIYDLITVSRDYGKTVQIHLTPFSTFLKAGLYTLRAKYGSNIQSKDVEVTETTLTRAVFEF